jgi:hypothetical protein
VSTGGAENSFFPRENPEETEVRAIDALPPGGFVNAALFVLSDYRGINACARAARHG